MKKLSFFLLLSVISVGTTFAQSSDDSYLFNHLGGSVSVGTDGIGIDLATPVTPYLSLRAGVSFYPKIKYTKDNISYTRNGNKGQGTVEAKLNMFNGKVLFDAYPFGLKNSFHVTAGLFFGSSNIVEASFIEDVNAPIGAGINKVLDNGEQWTVKAQDHAIDLRLRTHSVKPYVGIGFGRAIPKKHVNVAFDLGVQFHGTPQLQGHASITDINSVDHYQWLDLEAKDFHFDDSFNKDVDDALDIIHKVKVWPVLNIRLTGRFF